MLWVLSAVLCLTAVRGRIEKWEKCKRWATPKQKEGGEEEGGRDREEEERGEREGPLWKGVGGGEYKKAAFFG